MVEPELVKSVGIGYVARLEAVIGLYTEHAAGCARKRCPSTDPDGRLIFEPCNCGLQENLDLVDRVQEERANA
jgi:hypothetical protein